MKDTEREEGRFAALLSTIDNGGNTSFPIDGTHTGIEGRCSTCVPKGMFIESDLFWVKITVSHSELTFLKPTEYYFYYQTGRIKRLIIFSVGEGTWKSTCSDIFF